MTIVYRVVSVLGILMSVASTVVMLVTLRRERPIGILSPALSAALSLIALPLFVLLSGARLNLIIALPLFLLGLLAGAARGLTTRLLQRDHRVVGRHSWLFLLGWGGSLALAQACILFDSALLASAGLAPLCLSTGTQVGSEGTLWIRRVLFRPSAAATRAG